MVYHGIVSSAPWQIPQVDSEVSPMVDRWGNFTGRKMIHKKNGVFERQCVFHIYENYLVMTNIAMV